MGFYCKTLDMQKGYSFTAVASSMIGCEKSGSNRRKQFKELKSKKAKNKCEDTFYFLNGQTKILVKIQVTTKRKHLAGIQQLIIVAFIVYHANEIAPWQVYCREYFNL